MKSKRESTTPAKPTSMRNTLIGLVHLAFARLNYSDAEYRDLLEKMTGKRSCKELSDDQLDQLVKEFREAGALEDRRKPAKKFQGGAGLDRPTPKQWAWLDKLARDVGYEGLEDAGLATFVRRVAKVDSPRFLTRTTVSKVITGLQRWADQKAAKASQGGAA
ncbi:MAG: regulatory protein GemA [Methylococcaceae bacterium]|nr:MAG: regulatory protein GemA [Methylococcaceae bacterium]